MRLGNNNQWLFFQLKNMGLPLAYEYNPYINVSATPTVRIWTPGPDEYIITEEIVMFLASEGVRWISYPDSWCSASLEAETKAEELGVLLLEHKKTFQLVRKRYGI